MKVTDAERARKLEASVLMLEREVKALKEKKESLHSQLVAATGTSGSDDILVSFPCYEYCGRHPQKKFCDVPIEQFSNLSLQFEVATKSVRDQNNLDMKCISELKKYIKEQEQTERRWRKKIKDLKDKTGVDLASCSDLQRQNLLKLQSYESDTCIKEIEARRKLLNKEIYLASLLVKSKGKTLQKAKERVDELENIQNENSQLANDIRVIRRDIDVEKNGIEDAEVLWNSVATGLEEKKNVEATSRLLVEQVQQLVQNLSEEREVMLLEKYGPQERLLKAQDYRLRQLEKRRRAAEGCLRHHCSINAVNAILESKWESSPVASAETLDNLLDVDRVIPADEQIHPALHNLFVREKERLAQVICKINILVAEKESVMAAQACKLEALSRACNQSIQELDDVINSAAFEEESLRQQAVQWARQQRDYYCDLMREKSRLLSYR